MHHDEGIVIRRLEGLSKQGTCGHSISSTLVIMAIFCAYVLHLASRIEIDTSICSKCVRGMYMLT